jgi:hypothetical protein
MEISESYVNEGCMQIPDDGWEPSPLPRVAQRDVSSEPIGSTGHFTPIASLLTTSWA